VTCIEDEGLNAEFKTSARTPPNNAAIGAAEVKRALPSLPLYSTYCFQTLSRAVRIPIVSKLRSSARTQAVTPGPGRIERLAHEAWYLFVIGVSLFLLIALTSFHPDDPGWSSSGAGGAVHNLTGLMGAWLSDVLLSLLGYVALLAPLATAILAIRAWRKHRSGQESNRRRTSIAVRIVAALVAVAATAALCSLAVAGSPTLAPQGSGGIAGQMLSSALVGVLNPVGATLLLLTLMAVSLPLAALFSWLTVFEAVGSGVMSLMQRLGDAWSAWSQRREAAREAKAARPFVQPAAARAAPSAASPAPAAAAAKTPPSVPSVLPALSRKAKKGKEKSEQQLALPIHEADQGGDVPPYVEGEELPPLSILDPPRPSKQAMNEADVDRISQELQQHLASFGIQAEVVDRLVGPVVTRFELRPAPGVKGSQITNLSRDLARALSVASVRVIEVIAGKSVIGLEIPNQHRDVVSLGEILHSPAYQGMSSPLAMALGKDIAGRPVVVDLGKMPHLMVAGTTGSGKSVAINVMILSMLYKATKEQLRFIFIDPKMLELSIYEGIPHLLTPVVTDMKDAANALRWCVNEMERRYQLMTRLGVRNIAGLNRKITEAAAAGHPIPDPLASMPLFADGEEDPDAPAPPNLEAMPHIVIVIDELADMMMVVGKKVEELIARIAQKARAAGIHMIVATQRPSVDVITGLIKANIPSRLAFQVASRIDSRTILDEMGAETLLGHGDGLFRPVGASRLDRVHGAFVDDHEVHKVAKYLRQVGEPEYIEAVCAGEPETSADGGGGDAEQDPLYDQAVAIVLESGKASTSWVQRRLKIGYNRAARMIEQMEAAGVVGPSGPGGNRDILAPGGKN
jgi:S-DNA-T family DNA segregation ATPase FtsK/SpoIIIE